MDSGSKLGRRFTAVTKYGLEVRAALDQIRKAADANTLFQPTVAAAGTQSRPASPRTSVGIQLAGTKVRGLIPCSPAALCLMIFVGDEVLSVDYIEAGPHNVRQLLVGVDKAGSIAHIQVRSAKSGALLDVDLVRADAMEVKTWRNLSDWLAHIRDGSSSATAEAAVKILKRHQAVLCHALRCSRQCILLQD
jgi:hypothetical protein